MVGNRPSMQGRRFRSRIATDPQMHNASSAHGRSLLFFLALAGSAPAAPLQRTSDEAKTWSTGRKPSRRLLQGQWPLRCSPTTLRAPRRRRDLYGLSSAASRGTTVMRCHDRARSAIAINLRTPDGNMFIKDMIGACQYQPARLDRHKWPARRPRRSKAISRASSRR